MHYKHLRRIWSEKKIFRKLHIRPPTVFRGVTAETPKDSLIKYIRDSWASPWEKSKENVQRQKVKFECLNMKESKATWHLAHFWLHFLCFGIFLAILVLGQKFIILRIIIKNNFITLKNPAYRTHWISRPMRRVGPIQFW